MIASRDHRVVQTHNSVNVGASGNSFSPTWVDTWGYSNISLTLSNDGTTASSGDLIWSHDGLVEQGRDTLILPSSTVKNRAVSTVTKARYVKNNIINGDAAVHVMSAWMYLTT